MQPPPSAPYNNVDYLHNLMRQQQLRQQQPQQQQPAQSTGDDVRQRGGRGRGGRGGAERGRGQKRDRDERGRELGRGQPSFQQLYSEDARAGERAEGREGSGYGCGRGGWHERGRGRGRGGGGGGGGGQHGRQRRVIDDPHYDFETGQIDPAYPTGWDADCRLVTTLDAVNSTRPLRADSSGTEAAAAEEGREAEEAKLSPASPSSPSSAVSWRSYCPLLLGSFTFDTSMTASSPPLRHFPSILHRIATPGVAPVFREPELPLVVPVSQSQGRRQVTKPPLAVLLHVAHRHEKLLAGASLVPHFSSSSNSPAGLTFVAYRNSLRSVLESREPSWRVDVQRWGECLLLRRHLDYSWEETEDVGHRFEAACTHSAAEQTVEGDEGDDGEDRRGFRGLVAGRVGRHLLVTSSEIDAVSAQAASQLRLSDLLELKTAFAGLSHGKWREKLKSYWLQSFLGGVQTVTVGLKQRTGSADSPAISIAELRQEAVDGLASEAYKDAQMQRLSALFDLLAERVEEGRLYKLVREEAEQEQAEGSAQGRPRRGYRTALYEIVGGAEKWPIWRPEHCSSSSGSSSSA